MKETLAQRKQILEVGRSYNKPAKVLFVGGCQTEGFPIGRKDSFPSIVADLLAQTGLPVEIARLTYLKMSHSKRLLGTKFNPDILILQVGHFELSLGRRVRNLLPRMLRARKRHLGEVGTAPPDYAEIAVLDTGSWRYRMRDAIRSALDSVTGHCLVDLHSYERDMGDFFSQVRAMGIPRVVVLSPFPCVDSTTMYYRKAGSSARALAERYGFEYLDVMAFDPEPRSKILGPAEFYVDAYHLGIAGHQAVAHAIVEVLAAREPCLSRSGVNETATL